MWYFVIFISEACTRQSQYPSHVIKRQCGIIFSSVEFLFMWLSLDILHKLLQNITEFPPDSGKFLYFLKVKDLLTISDGTFEWRQWGNKYNEFGSSFLFESRNTLLTVKLLQRNLNGKSGLFNSHLKPRTFLLVPQYVHYDDLGNRYGKYHVKILQNHR